MATLAQGDVSTSAIGRIVRGMAVIGGHGMPEGAPCRTESGGGRQGVSGELASEKSSNSRRMNRNGATVKRRE
jgi:hypothetical protein